MSSAVVSSSSTPTTTPSSNSPWGQPNRTSPWGRKSKSAVTDTQPSSISTITTHEEPRSLVDIEREQKQDQRDQRLAKELQQQEDELSRALKESEASYRLQQALVSDQLDPSFLASLTPQPKVQPNSDECKNHVDDDDDGEERDAACGSHQLSTQEQLERDAALAAKLQEAEDGCQSEGRTSSAPAVTTSTNAGDLDTSQDFALALALQEQLNCEHEEALDHIEHMANRTPSKLSISMDKHRLYPRDRSPQAEELSAEEEAEEWDDSHNESYRYDHRVRHFRDRDGVIVTKHNKADSERRNRRKMESHFPIGFNCGDLKGAKRLQNDVRLNNKVFNQLKRFADKGAKQAARLHEKKEHSTAVMAMDKNTRVLVFKMINADQINSVDGVVSTGKESVIFHGTRTQSPTEEAPEAHDSDAHGNVNNEPEQQRLGMLPEHEVEVALKVFKTTLTEFTERQQFLHGDRRYAKRVGKQHARKLVKLWAEKELANLSRLETAGVPCPHVYEQRQHVLIMSFIGRGGRPAPKLKDIDWERKSRRNLQRCYDQVCAHMKTMYTECKLVHCDLSEYNILWFDKMAWIIDVGQSVETRHGRALAYLYRDCNNITQFFERVGCQGVMSAPALFSHITGKKITSEQGMESVQHIPILDKRGKVCLGDSGDTSDIVFRSDAVSLDELRNALQDTSDGDDESGSSSGSGMEHDDDHANEN